jgi:diacylglycerol kinase family enzyme
MADISSSISDAAHRSRDDDTNNGTSAVETNFSLTDEDVIAIARLPQNNTSLEYTLFCIVSSEEIPFKLRITREKNLPRTFIDKHIIETLPAQLSPSNNDIYILISTLSGTGLAPSFFERILQPVLEHVGLDTSSYKVVRTESAESMKEFARLVLLDGANKGRKQTCVMLSGDGGMVDVINGLLRRQRSSAYIQPVLSQLPLGTGNALFHSLHRPHPISPPLNNLPSLYIQGLRTLLYGTPRSLPIFRATFSPSARLLTNEGRTATPIPNHTLYGAVVASYGFHAALVADSDTAEYRRHGDKRFGLVAKDLLFPEDGAMPHAYMAEITLFNSRAKGKNNRMDGMEEGLREVVERKEHAYVLATLVSNLEKAFTISPSSRPLDGQLRVVHFGPASGKQIMEIMTKAYDSGKHVGMEWEGEDGFRKVHYEDVNGLRVDFKESSRDWKWRRCCIDGLIVGVEKGGWMEVRRMEKGDEVVNVVVDV